MRHSRVIVFMALVLAASAQGQQPKQPEVGTRPQPTVEPLDIWQIDLNPSGTGFALTTPVDEGDVYVFKVWPDRAIVRLPKTRVKKMVRRTKDVGNEFLYQIDLVPSGQIYARDVPMVKGGTYLFHSWAEGTYMSLRQGDVQKVTKVTGLDAFKVHLQLLGAKAIGNLPMQGGGTVSVIPDQSAAAAAADSPSQGQSQTPSNWIYQGVPGVTDAWAPPSAVVSAPGDLPRAQPHF